MPLDFTEDKSTLVQVMAWCQCWPRSLSPYGVTRPQWFDSLVYSLTYPESWHCHKWPFRNHLCWIMASHMTILNLFIWDHVASQFLVYWLTSPVSDEQIRRHFIGQCPSPDPSYGLLSKTKTSHIHALVWFRAKSTQDNLGTVASNLVKFWTGHNMALLIVGVNFHCDILSCFCTVIHDIVHEMRWKFMVVFTSARSAPI